jgi:hypothetical protein
VNKNDFETKRQEIEGKLQKELGGEYKKIQVCDYFDNDGVEKYFFCEICINIVDNWDYREIGLISFLNGILTEVIGQINDRTIRILQKIIKKEE